MTIVPNKEISSVRIDKDHDIIPITVGLYRLFMSAGPAGRDAKDLYEHLIFTARLQETRQVRANNTYLARGLGWGQAKVKAAKAWLANSGLIEYMQTRGADGLLGEVYILLRFLPRAETLAARLEDQEEPEAVPVAEDVVRDDLTPDLFAEADKIDPSGAVDPVLAPPTTGSEIDPLVTAGSVIHPAVDRTPGAEQQMLKVNNQMLEVKKGKGDTPREPHLTIAETWYRRYQRETSIMIAPRADDHKAAAELARALGGDLSGLDEAVDTYFGRWREFWFAVNQATRRAPDDQKRPEWSFRVFCTRYPEILAAGQSKNQSPSGVGFCEPSPTGPAPCPVCGRLPVGMMRSCPSCGFDLFEREDPSKVSEHATWWADRQKGIAPVFPTAESLIFRLRSLGKSSTEIVI